MYSQEESTIEDGLFDTQATEEEFLAMLPPYLGIALRDNLEPVFHVFSDSRDIWTQDTHYAYETFSQWVEKYDAARLYIELYEDHANDDMVHENCLLSHGNYPM